MPSPLSEFRALPRSWSTALVVGSAVVLACAHMVIAPPPAPTTRASLGVVGEDSAAGIGVGYTRPRVAETGCSQPTVDVYIEAYPETKTANPDTPFNGEIRAAHIINTGRCATEMYHFLPFAQAEYELVMFWDNQSPRQQVLELRQIARSVGVQNTRKRGHAQGCKHKKADVSLADFWECSDGEHPNTMMGNTMGFFDLRLPNALLAYVAELKGAFTEARAWFSCTSGCCTAIGLN
jgi:hypothetical protein